MAPPRFKVGSEAHSRLIDDIERGLTDNQAARLHGVSASTVFYQRSKLGYPSTHDVRRRKVKNRSSASSYTDDDEAQIVIWSQDGLSYKDMHRLMPYHSAVSIRRRLIRLSQIDAIREHLAELPPVETPPPPLLPVHMPDVRLSPFDRSALADMADRLEAGEPWHKVGSIKMHGRQHRSRMRMIERSVDRSG